MSPSPLFIPHNGAGLRDTGLMNATLSHVAVSCLMPTAAALCKWGEKARRTPAALGQHQSTRKVSDMK